MNAFLVAHPSAVCCTSGGNAVNTSVLGVNTSVLGMVAKGMDACDNVSCSTTLHGTLYKLGKRCKYQCFGRGCNMNDVLIPPPPHPTPPQTRKEEEMPEQVLKNVGAGTRRVPTTWRTVRLSSCACVYVVPSGSSGTGKNGSLLRQFSSADHGGYRSRRFWGFPK